MHLMRLACEDENSKFLGTIALTNGSPALRSVIGRNVRDYLVQRETPGITKDGFRKN